MSAMVTAFTWIACITEASAFEGKVTFRRCRGILAPN